MLSWVDHIKLIFPNKERSRSPVASISLTPRNDLFSASHSFASNALQRSPMGFTLIGFAPQEMGSDYSCLGRPHMFLTRKRGVIVISWFCHSLISPLSPHLVGHMILLDILHQFVPTSSTSNNADQLFPVGSAERVIARTHLVVHALTPIQLSLPYHPASTRIIFY